MKPSALSVSPCSTLKVLFALTVLSLTVALFSCCAPARTTVKAVSNADNTVISVTISGNTTGGTSSVDVRPSIDSNQIVIKPYVP